MTKLVGMRVIHGLLCAALALSSLASACGDDEAATGAADGGKTSAALPQELVEGTVIAWNPSLKITSGTQLTYENEDAASSQFTASISNATYQYVLSSTGATLTIDGQSAEDGKLLSDLPAEILLVKGGGHAIEVEIDGTTFDGVLTPPMPNQGHNTVVPDEIDGEIPKGATATHVHAALVGKHMLQFGYVQSGAPFEEGRRETFVVGDDDTLTVMDKKISNPYELDGNEAAILWNDGEHIWELTDNAKGAFNEVNVSDAKSGTWFGQWADPSKFEEMPDTGSDAMKDVKLSVNSSGMLGDAVPPPYAQGSELTCNWDGKTGLTVTQDGESVTPKFDSEVDNGDQTRTLKFVSEDSTADEGYTYGLKLDADNGIVSLSVEHFVYVDKVRLNGFSEASP